MVNPASLTGKLLLNQTTGMVRPSPPTDCACVNRMYGIGMGDVVALPNAEAQVFRYELKEYWRPWLSKLVAYWEQQFTPLAEQALMAIQEEYGHNRRLVKAD